MSVYFAHSMLSYGTKKEQADKVFIQEHFGEQRFVDPSLLGSNSMKFYYALVEDCDALVFTEYAKSIGKGVWSEIRHALNCGVSVFLLRKGKFYASHEFNVVVFNKNDWKKHYAKVKLTKPKEGA